MCVPWRGSGLTLSWEPVRVPHCQRDQVLLPRNEVEAAGWPVSLSDLTYFCPPWDACLVQCVALSSVHSPRFPSLAPSPGQDGRDRSSPVVWFRWLLYHHIFTPSLEALISCSAQVFWHLEHTVWSCSAWGSEGPATCLHASSTQEVFSERWPLTVMRQCREASPEWIGGYSGSACFAVGDTMVLVSFGELHDPRELWRKGHCSVLPFPDFQTTTSLCTVLL